MEDQRQSIHEKDLQTVENNKQKNELKQFILMLATSPSLWDPSDRNYLNNEKKIKELDKLVPIYTNIKPNATRDDVRKKINSLRSNYRKELRKIENSKRSGCGADEIYKPTSSTFYLLQFLAEIEIPKLKKENGVNIEDDLVVSSMINESPPVKIKKNSVTLTKQNELLKACSSLPQSSVPSHQDVNPLALVWSDKLNSLNPTQKLYAEKAIHDILFETQLNNLNRHSVEINTSETSSSPAWSRYPYTPSPVSHVPAYLIPDTFETFVSPDTSTSYPNVLHKPESDIPFLNASGSTFTHPKPIIISGPKRKKTSSTKTRVQN